MKRIQHLMEAWYHLNQVEGMELEKRRIEIAIKAIYEAKTENLLNEDLINRLTDEELAAAIRLQDKRIGMERPANPKLFNYIVNTRPNVAAVEFSRRNH